MSTKYVALFLLLVLSCAPAGPRAVTSAGSDIYDGKVYGIYEPLEVKQDEAHIVVSGGTWAYTIDRSTGQIVSARVLDREFMARGSSFPNPYVGLMPENDPGADREGGTGRERFGFEKAVEMRPKLWSGGLTGAFRFDAEKSTGVVTELTGSSPETAAVRSAGVYSGGGDGKPTALSWEIDYLFDVDGFTRVTVKLSAERPVKLRWHCFNHAVFSRESIDFISRYPDLGAPAFDLRPAPTESIKHLQQDMPVLESHWNPVFHLGNPLTGIEFSKEDFTGRLSGYRDSRVQLEDGRVIDTGAVETADGRWLRSHDSRGRQGIFTG